MCGRMYCEAMKYLNSTSVSERERRFAMHKNRTFSSPPTKLADQVYQKWKLSLPRSLIRKIK